MKRLLPICLALLMAGCVASREFAAFEAASSEKALIRWQRKGKSLVYDAVCARTQDGSVLVRLYKQSPTPLAEFRLGSDNSFNAGGRLAGRGWSGPGTEAPPHFSGWVWFLTAYQRSAQPGAFVTPERDDARDLHQVGRQTQGVERVDYRHRRGDFRNFQLTAWR